MTKIGLMETPQGAKLIIAVLFISSMPFGWFLSEFHSKAMAKIFMNISTPPPKYFTKLIDKKINFIM